MEKLQEMNNQDSQKSLATSKLSLKTNNINKTNKDMQTNVDAGENDIEPLAKKRRLMKQDMKIMAEQSSKATKEDDLFDAFNKKTDGSGLSILDIPIPDIPSPMISDRQQDEDDQTGQNMALFKSNHIHKIHNRIKPQLVSSTLPSSNPTNKAKYALDTKPTKQSINVLERRIEKAIKTVKEEHRRNRDGDDYDSESLGDEDTEDGEDELDFDDL